MQEMKFCPICAAPLGPQTTEGRERLHCSSDSCDYVFYDNPVPVVAALVEHGQTVLLVRGKGGRRDELAADPESRYAELLRTGLTEVLA